MQRIKLEGVNQTTGGEHNSDDEYSHSTPMAMG